MKSKPHFAVALWSTSKGAMALTALMIVLNAAYMLAQPLLIKAIIAFVAGEENMFGADSGNGLALMLATTALVGTTFVNLSFYLTSRIGGSAQITMVNAVSQKILQSYRLKRGATSRRGRLR
ncbi:hypothetical protein Poli38472_004667 [Pythium oligandrum]|uniref:ABC transmembrane type-1 domain-containing protein n=1 Tax=Pythium oligandrum TaxID=41045 RepID=A0A8K1CAV4_PYTOL|nr:hypothetical protein Poli38472_004667 [Pythium oligandrum]|eukprot:TMW59598.1 hypothetical protein Poli38472_004667 [Pythium oligandrum]